MKKVILVLISIILIFTGILGYYYFTNVGTASNIINTAIEDINKNNYDEAIEKLKTVISSYNYQIIKNPATFLIGVCYENKNNYKKALEYYKKLLLIGNFNFYKYEAIINVCKIYRKGYQPINQRQLKILINYLKKELSIIEKKLDEQDSNKLLYKMERIYNNLLSLSFSINLKKEPVKILKDKLSIELGYLYIKDKDYKNAVLIFSRYNNFEARYGLAIAYFKMGNLKDGIKVLSSIVENDKKGIIKNLYLKKLYEYAVKLYSKGEYKESIKYLKSISNLSNYPEYSENSMYLLAEYYYKMGKKDQALLYYKKVLSNGFHKWDENALFKIGLIYYDKRMYYKALKSFDTFIKKYPHSKRLKEAKQWKDICERSIKYFN